MPIALVVILAILQTAPEIPGILDAIRRWIRPIVAAQAEGRAPTQEEIDAVLAAALEEGHDFRDEVRARLAPGGDWEGKGELPPEPGEGSAGA